MSSEYLLSYYFITAFYLFHSCVPKPDIKIKALLLAGFTTALQIKTCGERTLCILNNNDSRVLRKALFLCFCGYIETVQGSWLIKSWFMEPACAFDSLWGVHLDVAVGAGALCEPCTSGVLGCRNRQSASETILVWLVWFGFCHFMSVLLWMSSRYLVVRCLNDDRSKYE